MANRTNRKLQKLAKQLNIDPEVLQMAKAVHMLPKGQHVLSVVKTGDSVWWQVYHPFGTVHKP